MLAQEPATKTNINCTEHLFPEFPDMLFGKSTEGINYFDATTYLQKHKPESSPDDFFVSYKPIIDAIIASYSLSEPDIHIVNEEGHHLIDGNLTYLFIAFTEPGFWGHIFDRIHDMYSSGFCVSDTYLVSMTKSRIPEAIMTEAYNGNI